MAIYRYIANNAQGETLRGTIEADSLANVAVYLTSVGLFMVSAALEDTPLPAEDSPESSSHAAEREESEKKAARLKWEVAGVILLALGYGVFSRSSVPVIPDPSVLNKVAEIRLGMRREEVEKLLTRYGNGRSPQLTRYLDFKQALIDVPYDNTGGEWNPDNRVTGTPQIYTKLKGVDHHLEPE